jgi:hypothetical protein
VTIAIFGVVMRSSYLPWGGFAGCPHWPACGGAKAAHIRQRHITTAEPTPQGQAAIDTSAAAESSRLPVEKINHATKNIRRRPTLKMHSTNAEYFRLGDDHVEQ